MSRHTHFHLDSIIWSTCPVTNWRAGANLCESTIPRKNIYWWYSSQCNKLCLCEDRYFLREDQGKILNTVDHNTRQTFQWNLQGRGAREDQEMLQKRQTSLYYVHFSIQALEASTSCKHEWCSYNNLIEGNLWWHFTWIDLPQSPSGNWPAPVPIRQLTCPSPHQAIDLPQSPSGNCLSMGSFFWHHSHVTTQPSGMGCFQWDAISKTANGQTRTRKTENSPWPSSYVHEMCAHACMCWDPTPWWRYLCYRKPDNRTRMQLLTN